MLKHLDGPKYPDKLKNIRRKEMVEYLDIFVDVYRAIKQTMRNGKVYDQ